jgi:thioredoxin 1
MDVTPYVPEEPTRDEVDHLPGPLLLNFGTNWCGYCQAIQVDLAQLLAKFPEVRQLKIEDGRGKPLGRSFRVKLWPTLVFLRDGKVVQQVSRPGPAEIREGLRAITGKHGDPLPAQA